ncbi:KdsC family phosphatase [Candidatus Symbiobacter mobilis]|uniref:3-deoxy-D-manno-octulosonate 8-phosphate phosphatase KdsC n=1 Tax=Candidatus Symbiobacter mobilis CR TaxID=946483 RepID=U5N788_9BURK|nr:HAD hydrolase family protein [Candidatus Symbiobacter mobilis]AGX87170.1 3-deoxy-D-manno-octulosonate 8-phosphate phosphatase [Candidatus Symbiobacter mobilis CR]
MTTPVLSFSPELLLRAQGVRLLILDVDGVMTDAGLYFGAGGEVLKRFHAHDGLGLRLLAGVGIHVAVITGLDSEPVRARLRALGIEHAHYGQVQKLPAALSVLQVVGATWEQTAVMGDDWHELPLMQRCALSCAPPNAHPEVLAAVHYTTRRRGGEGAVRECCDLLLTAGGHYARLLHDATA